MSDKKSFSASSKERFFSHSISFFKLFFIAFSLIKTAAAINDYSMVEQEFSRLFASQNLKTSNKKAKNQNFFSNKENFLPLIEFFSRNQNERAQENHKTELSLESCKNIHLLCGQDGREEDNLLSKLEKPLTEPGTIFFAGLLTTPIYDPKRLKNRKKAIQLLSKNKEFSNELTACIEKFNEPIQTIISIKNSNYKNDSSCLLNNFFTFYWQNKSFSALVPKKFNNFLKKESKESKKDKKHKKKPFENSVDKNNFLLNISVAGTVIAITIGWFSQVFSLIKNQAEVFNVFGPVKQFFLGSSFSQENYDAARATFPANKIDDIVAGTEHLTQEEIDAGITFCKELGERLNETKSGSAGLFTSQFKAEFRHDTQQLMKNPRSWLITGPKMLKRVIKPIYVILLPAILISKAVKEFNLYKVAIARARQEIAEMEKLIKLFEQLIKIINEQSKSNPEIETLLEEFDLLFHIKNLIGNIKDDEFGHLISSLKDGSVKTPGCFLRMYKELYLSIDRLGWVLEAIGQIDAFLAISRLSSRPEFCFANFIENSQLPEILADQFWDPQIGYKTSIPNSIKIGPKERGMIITGSNASGKSTFMRGIFRNSIMAQTIILVPAKNFSLTPFKETFTLMSKKDDPPNRSQFRVEADLISQFLAKTNNDCFMLSAIDEMFNTTGSQDCQALTRAIIEHISTKQKTITLISTHNPAIAKAEADSENVFKNYKITADRDNFGHFSGYCRKIQPGVADHFDSTALEVALLAGIDEQIVNRARQIKLEISNF